VAISETLYAVSSTLAQRVRRLEDIAHRWGVLTTRTVGSSTHTAASTAGTGFAYLTYLSSDPCLVDQIDLVMSATSFGYIDFWIDNENGTMTRWGTPISVTLAAGANTVALGAIEVPARCFIGYRRLAGGTVMVASGVGFGFTMADGAVAVGSTAAYITGTGRIAQKVTIREPANRKRVFGVGGADPVEVVRETFPSTATPTSWTLGTGFSVSDGLSATGAGAWNYVTLYNPGAGANCSIHKRLIAARITISDAATIHGLCLSGSNVGGLGNALLVDCPAGKLRLYKWTGSTTAGTLLAEVALPASILAAIAAPATFKVGISLERDGGTLIAKLTNMASSETVTVSHTYSTTDGETPGHGRAGMMHLAGTAKTTFFSAHHKMQRDVGTMILGDSNAEGAFGTVLPSWAMQAAAASSRVLVAARSAATTANVLAQIREVLFHKPKRVVIALGTNDTTLALWQGNMPVLIDYVRSVGAEPILITLTPLDGAQARVDSMNADVLAGTLGTWRVIDFAAVVTTNNDRVTWDATYKYNGSHVNLAGNNRMYAQLLAEVPEALL